MSYNYNNIWSSASYIFQPTLSGVTVYNSDASSIVSEVLTPSGVGIVTSVWADNDYLYISTTASGIYKSDLTIIESAPQITSYLNYPTITNNNVRYIHGNNNQLCIVTISGVDHISITTGSGIYTLCDDSYKCFQTVSGTFYYTKNYKTISEIDLGGSLTDWLYYRDITLTNTTSGINDRVLLEIEGFSYEHIQSNGNDLRFITDEGVVLEYFIDTYTQDQYFKVVINVPIIGINSLYMLHGNSTVSSGTTQIDWEYPIISSSAGIEKSWSDEVTGKLYAVYDNTVNWQEESIGYSYDLKTMLDGYVYYLNDVFITENTSEYNNDNVIFLATNHGAIVIEEHRGYESSSRIKRYYLK